MSVTQDPASRCHRNAFPWLDHGFDRGVQSSSRGLTVVRECVVPRLDRGIQLNICTAQYDRLDFHVGWILYNPVRNDNGRVQLYVASKHLCILDIFLILLAIFQNVTI